MPKIPDKAPNHEKEVERSDKEVLTIKNIPRLAKSQVFVPHDYQRVAIDFLLSNPFSGLFLDPGLGKTSISLSAMCELKKKKAFKGVLLIAPKNVCLDTWPNEIAKWNNFSHLTHVFLHGKNKTKQALQSNKDIYLINPQGIVWLVQTLNEMIKAKDPIPFNILWIDESTKFKNPSTTGFKQLKRTLKLFKIRHIMTGTPKPKNYLDLWPQVYLLDRGEALDTSFHRFKATHFESHDFNQYHWEIKPGHDKIIAEKIKPLVLDMSSQEHLSLPELRFNDIAVTLDAKQSKTYFDMEKQLMADVFDETVTAMSVAASVSKCQQIVGGFLYTEDKEVLCLHREKLNALIELVEQLDGSPLLVAYKFRHELDALLDTFPDAKYIGGGVKPEDTKSIIADWNSGELPVLFGHPSSMAHGINMQKGGHDLCWYSLTWSLEDYQQMNARLYRQGVQKPVTIHHLVAKGVKKVKGETRYVSTVDDKMLQRLQQRDASQKSLREFLRGE